MPISTQQPAWLRPYDPADSPGPIPSVIAQLSAARTGGDADTERRPSGRPSRYTVVLVPPDAAAGSRRRPGRGRPAPVPRHRLGPVPGPPRRGGQADRGGVRRAGRPCRAPLRPHLLDRAGPSRRLTSGLRTLAYLDVDTVGVRAAPPRTPAPPTPARTRPTTAARSAPASAARRAPPGTARPPPRSAPGPTPSAENRTTVRRSAPARWRPGC